MGLASAAGLKGFQALKAGDTARARTLLTLSRLNQRRRTTPNRILSPSILMSLTLGRIELARRNYSAARIALADAYPAYDAATFLGDAEELRGQISLAQGDTAAARKAFHNVVKIWSDGDPAVQPRVSAARAILARIDPVRP
jgi:predicted negative regulator of RcsB-dependent stress response